MEKLLKTLKSGGIILYPTDTIWGIGCDATDDEAVMKIFKLKNRDQNKPLIILVESEKRLQDLVKVPAVAWDIMDLSEKPITIVYDAPKGISKNLLAEDGSIGIRLVKDEFCKILISKLNKPIVSTSANFSGEKSPKSFADISQKLINKVDAVAEDQNRVSKWEASSIIRVWSDGRIKVIRE
jgi:sua5/yciO/yrdC/ywlC family protein